MPERLNICCYVTHQSDRGEFVERLYSTDPEWMGKPDEIVVIHSNGTMAKCRWNSMNLDATLRESEQCFVSSGESEDRAVVSIDLLADQDCYTASVANMKFRSSSISDVERHFVRFSEFLDSENSILTAGFELESQKSTAALMEEICAGQSLVSWILSRRSIPEANASFEMILHKDEYLLLRHKDAAARLAAALNRSGRT